MISLWRITIFFIFLSFSLFSNEKKIINELEIKILKKNQEGIKLGENIELLIKVQEKLLNPKLEGLDEKIFDQGWFIENITQNNEGYFLMQDPLKMDKLFFLALF